ncbi:MAG TPA: 4Fe-4S double cluster binding domain-containing protein [Spirochaetota bacterium]|nr:4Fe-4S double cluster binding domain-containing protein [Spirochaetota bacterium]
MVDLVKTLAKDLGIDAVGFYNLYDNRDSDFDTQVKSVFPSAKSIISFGYSYNFDWNQTDESCDGYIAKYTTANFYKILSKKLQFIAKRVKSEINCSIPNDKFFRIYVNSRINDKRAAFLSNLGYFSNNSLIFVNETGIKTILGSIIIDYEFYTSKNKPTKDFCSNCNLCVESCPTKAIGFDRSINKNHCIQHLSSQMILPDTINNKKIFDIWKNRFFGCSTCVDACPYFSKNIKTYSEELVGFIGLTFDCENVLTMRKEDYKIRFANNQLSASWIPSVTLARNGLINLFFNQKYNLMKEFYSNINYYNWNEFEKEFLISFIKNLLAL